MEPIYDQGEFCLEAMSAVERVQAELAEARAELVLLIHDRLSDFAADERRFLLTVKRDSHNQRSLRRHEKSQHWSLLGTFDKGLASQIVRLERQAEARLETLSSVIAEARRIEGESLLSVLENQGFRRGLTLASPHLMANIRRRAGRPLDLAKRKDRKLEQSLIRFVSRAAAKTSPFSTLTPVSLGIISDSAAAGLRFASGPLQEHSLVRSHRWLVDRLQELLLRHAVIREGCQASLNETSAPMGEDRYKFLRPAHWAIDKQSGETRLHPSTQVSLTLRGPTVEQLIQQLEASSLPYGELVDRLSDSDDQDERRGVMELVDRLVDLGFVLLSPPWSSYEPRLEETLLRVAIGARLETIADLLHQLIDSQDSLARSLEPEMVLRRINTIQGELIAACQEASDLPDGAAQIDRSLPSGAEIYEDVSLGAVQDAAGAIVHLDSASAEDILSHGEVIYRYCYLFSHRHDVMEALAELWRRHWPQQREIPFLELFTAALPMWNRYLAFHREFSSALYSTFDPFQSEVAEELRRLRVKVATETQKLVRQGSDGSLSVDVDQMRLLLAEVPQKYGPLVGPCFFLQPADSTAKTWIVNRIFEGTGRYGSRFQRVLGPLSRKTLENRLKLGAEAVEGRGELLDLFYGGGSTSNTREPYTRHVLQLPGEHVQDDERRVLFSDLVVHFDPSSEALPTLHDRTGERRWLPVHLSSLNHAFLPTMLRFLSAFGPYEVRQVLPRPPAVENELGTIDPRFYCGPLVLRRRRWRLIADGLRRALDGCKTEAEMHLQVNRWRQRAGLPREVYFYEETDSNGKFHKPQYVDFASPCLVALICKALESHDELIMEEALPAPRDNPVGGDGVARVVEIHLDTLTHGRVESAIEDSSLALTASANTGPR